MLPTIDCIWPLPRELILPSLPGFLLSEPPRAAPSIDRWSWPTGSLSE